MAGSRRWAGLVRNVMVGREGLHRAVLVRIFEDAGGADVRSHLTTGNLTFEASSRAHASAVGRRAEVALAAVLGRREPVILREIDRLRELVTEEPLPPPGEEAWELEVGFLPLDVAPLEPARIPDPGRTVVLRATAHELFTARPRAGGGRPHVVTLLEAATGSRATARGWSTLAKLVVHGA